VTSIILHVVVVAQVAQIVLAPLACIVIARQR